MHYFVPQVCPRGVADRVNLGLIPSSEDGWPVACAALKPQTGGMLHIHGNVTSHPRTKKTNSAFSGPKPPHYDVGFPSGETIATDNASFKEDGGMIEAKCEQTERTNPAGLRTADNAHFCECSSIVTEGNTNFSPGEPCKLSSKQTEDSLRLEFNSSLNSETEADSQHQGVWAERNSSKHTTGVEEDFRSGV